MSAATFLARAAREIGYVEGGGSNGRSGNRTKYGRWYGLDGQPYCDMGLSWVGAQVGESAAVGKFAYCPAHELWFRRRGQWGSTPRVGAFVFFSFGSREAIHVGVVERVLSGGRIQTIEFNTSASNAGSQNNGGGVYRRIRPTSWGIRGYGYPAYGKSSSGGVSRDTTRTGRLAEDGVFGPGTIRATQKWVGTTADGVWGPGSKRALQRKVGAKPVDGIVGPGTIRLLQRWVGASQDGQWGRGTTRALQKYLNAH